jgi:hypothetical protein
MPYIVIGEQNDEIYNISEAIKALAVDGSEISWWVPFVDTKVDCLGFYGLLTTPDGTSYDLIGLKFTGHPVELQREISLISNETLWWDCRESDWVDTEPEPISINELWFLSNTLKDSDFKKVNITRTRYLDESIIDFFRENIDANWYSGLEGTYLKVIDTKSQKTVYWSYIDSWKHGKKKLCPIFGFSPGKAGPPLISHYPNEQLV